MFPCLFILRYILFYIVILCYLASIGHSGFKGFLFEWERVGVTVTLAYCIFYFGGPQPAVGGPATPCLSFYGDLGPNPLVIIYILKPFEALLLWLIFLFCYLFLKGRKFFSSGN